MSDRLSIEHTTLGLMGPIVYTATRVMPVHCVIIQIGERVILIDSGFGMREMLEPNSLLGDDVLWRVSPLIDTRLTAFERLQARGIQAEQVTDIVLTHMDYDHAGGVHDFPNATIHVSQEELDSFESSRQRAAYRRYQIARTARVKTYTASSERWFDLEARSLQLPDELEAKLVPLPGHTLGHCGVAYREDGRWSLHAGDGYFDSKLNFIKQAPGLPIEVAFQTDTRLRQASLRKLQVLKAEHADEINLFCTHDQQEFADWTSARGRPDPILEIISNA